ncbi:MAG: UDP-N-acetylmuramate--L-alanine ligase [Acidimicrobiales bacterium]|nr:UDP-N-acetylmuramate--L-alanine ligase [Acidimicrobiales bacterium]
MTLKASDFTHVDLAELTAIHVVGAGGAGMNAIAAVLLSMGHSVSGSDLRESAGVNRLRSMGARIEVGHDASNIGNASLICRSTAVPDSNVEILAALDAGRVVLSRAEILAAICSNKQTIAVAGTHGKTTTSSMLALALTAAGLEPSFIVGGDLNDIGSGAVWNDQGELFVVEADESDGTFLKVGAATAIVTNLESDHLDYFGDYDALVQAFTEFLDAVDGPRIVCIDDPGAAGLATEVGGCLTYGTTEDADYRVVGINSSRYASNFEVIRGGKRITKCDLPVPGIHNVLNATAAFATAVEMGADPDLVTTALARFAGVARRFEFRGEHQGVVYVDDYAHLPTEVSAVLAAARTGDWERIVAVFQPHRYSRTAELWREFGDSFVDADHIVLTGIYSAGESPRPGITGDLLVRAILDDHPKSSVTYLPGREQVADYLDSILRPGDLCLTMGAGDLTSVADEVQSRRKSPRSSQ